MATKEQIAKGAEAYDRYALKERGWTPEQIDKALRISPLSPIALKTSKLILEAVETKH